MVEALNTTETEISVDKLYSSLMESLNYYLQQRQNKINRNKKLGQFGAELEDKEVRYDEEKHCICCDHVVGNLGNVGLKCEGGKFILVNWQPRPLNFKGEYSPKIKEYPLDEKEGNTCLNFFSAKTGWACDHLRGDDPKNFDRPTFQNMWKLVLKKITGRDMDIKKTVTSK